MVTFPRDQNQSNQEKATMNDNQCIKENTIINTYGGDFSVNWSEDSKISPRGYWLHYATYLSTTKLLDDLADSCPLDYRSNNAPTKKEILFTLLVAVTDGMKRYNHISALSNEQYLAKILNIKKLRSADSVRRAIKRMDITAARIWLESAMLRFFEPLLAESYVLDLDPTVKPLAGRQEGTEKSFNPKRKGHPANWIHTFVVSKLRLVLYAELHAGNEGNGTFSLPGLEYLLGLLPKNLHPSLVRGDVGFGNERIMNFLEDQNLRYLFKLRTSPGVKKTIHELLLNGKWEAVPDTRWEGCRTSIRLRDWTKERQIVIYRRVLFVKNDKDITVESSAAEQLDLFQLQSETLSDYEHYEWIVLITDFNAPLCELLQLYNDRADCENNFDELKNQFGWGGFTSHELATSNIMMQLVSLFYNWLNIFLRLGTPDGNDDQYTEKNVKSGKSTKTPAHRERISIKNDLLNVMGRISNHGGRNIVALTVLSANGERIKLFFDRIAEFLSSLQSTAPQLDHLDKWTLILSKVLDVFLDSKHLHTVSKNNQFILGFL